MGQEGDKALPRPAPEPRYDGAPLEPVSRGEASRCPHCHDALDPSDHYRCVGCGARYHLGCLAESTHRRCELCGQKVKPERRRPREPLVNASAQRSRAIAGGLVVGMLSTVLWCAAAVVVVDIPSIILGHGRKGIPTTPALLIGLILIVVGPWLTGRAVYRVFRPKPEA